MTPQERAASKFYERHRRAAIRHYGSDWKLYIACFAAVSPMNRLKPNAVMAHKAFTLIKDGKPLDGKFIATHLHNLRRVAAGLQLRGRKVVKFQAALLGDTKAVPIDRWVLRAFGEPESKLTAGSQLRVTRHIRRLASRWGLAPCEAQAVIWWRVRGGNPRECHVGCRE